MGYVPQDDIIHVELPLVSTLRYAAQLRLPSSTSAETVQQLVDDALERLDLAARNAACGSARRSRWATQASEHRSRVARPTPTCSSSTSRPRGLDPATSTGLLAKLRRLADWGATIVLTTHAVQDLSSCDRVLFLASGGRLAVLGGFDSPTCAAYFDVATVEDIYVALAQGDPASWAARRRDIAGVTLPARAEPTDRSALTARQRPGGLRQFTVLTRRTADTLVRNRLTLAILLGSPALVVA